MIVAIVILGLMNAALLAALFVLTKNGQSDLLEMSKMVHSPDEKYLDAIRAQSLPLSPEKDPVVELDEGWLTSEESLVPLGADDLSPLFDADEE